MKTTLYVVLALLLVYGCATTKNNDANGMQANTIGNDTVRITNDSLEYEIIIIEPGFNSFLASQARPEGFYSQSYLENKNRFLVADYNSRVMQPSMYGPELYPQRIDYSPHIDYGYEVNYKLYYYFVYFARTYNQRFSVSTRI